MADPNFKKISDMVALTTAAADDIIPIVDVSEAADADKNKKITTANLRKAITNAELDGGITAAKIAGLDSDPGADRMVFWDDGAASLAFLAPSTGLQIIDTAMSTKDSEIVHDNLSGYSANRHIDHTGVTITAGTGLSGGGDISANRTIAMSHLGIQSLTDPGADRIAFWDETAGAVKWLTPGDGLTLSDTTLSAGIAEGQIADGAVTNVKLEVGASKVTNRQGGSATNWNIAGTTNYALASARIQLGVAVTSQYGSTTVTFPVAFSKPPIVFPIGRALINGQFTEMGTVTETSFVVDTYDIDSNRMDGSLVWLAIGEA